MRNLIFSQQIEQDDYIFVVYRVHEFKMSLKPDLKNHESGLNG